LNFEAAFITVDLIFPHQDDTEHAHNDLQIPLTSFSKIFSYVDRSDNLPTINLQKKKKKNPDVCSLKF
jgi:hypothetical protein